MKKQYIIPTAEMLTLQGGGVMQYYSPNVINHDVEDDLEGEGGLYHP